MLRIIRQVAASGFQYWLECIAQKTSICYNIVIIMNKEDNAMDGDARDLFIQFIDRFHDELKGMGHVNLIISGKTGVGKSTLLNAAFREDLAAVGIGEPVTPEIRMYQDTKGEYPLRIYDTMGLELSAERQEFAIQQIKELCDKKKATGNMDDTIHVMWYCIHGNGARFEPYEEAFINEVSKEIPVIIVLTQCIIRRNANELKSEIEKRNTNASNILLVRAQQYIDDDDKVLDAFGVDQLVEYTYSILPEAVQKAWACVQGASIKIKQDRANAIVLATAAATFGEGYIPLPFSDCFALVPTQIGMIAGITAVYGLTISRSLLTGIVSSMLGTAGTTIAGRTIVAALLKFIPGTGTAAGGTLSGTTAMALTVALGEAYIQVMNRVYKGEISEKDFASGAIKQELTEVFKKNLNHELSKRN